MPFVNRTTEYGNGTSHVDRRTIEQNRTEQNVYLDFSNRVYGRDNKSCR